MGELADFLLQNDENFRRGRLPALYSDFRSQRTLNPDGYQANVSAWRHALSQAAWEGRISQRTSTPDLLVLRLDEQLLRSLEHKQFGRPLALGTVVGEAVARKELFPLPVFLKAKESIYQRSWTELPWGIVSWTLRQLGFSSTSSGEDRLPEGQFVVVRNVEVAAKLLDENVSASSSRFDRVFSKTHFQKTFADNLIEGRRLSGTDLELLLKFSARDKGSIVYDGKTIKVKGSGVDDGRITEEDLAIASLKELIYDLKHQTSLLSTRVDELGVAAKDAVSRKNRIAALAALKSKKLAESCLEKRFATLNQLELVAAKIEQASDQVQLVKVMESSTSTLRSLNAQLGGVDRAAEVVDRLREQMSEVDEVGDILADASAANVAINEGELDDELEAMEKEEKRKEDEAERARKEAEAERAAEALRQRLDEAGQMPSTPLLSEEQITRRESPATETAKELRRMELASAQPEAAG